MPQSNDLLMQFQADILNTKVLRPTITETTALGAAYLAGLAVGYWENVEAIQEQWQINRLFEPSMNNDHRGDLITGWQKAIKATIGLTK